MRFFDWTPVREPPKFKIPWEKSGFVVCRPLFEVEPDQPLGIVSPFADRSDERWLDA